MKQSRKRRMTVWLKRFGCRGNSEMEDRLNICQHPSDCAALATYARFILYAGQVASNMESIAFARWLAVQCFVPSGNASCPAGAGTDGLKRFKDSRQSSKGFHAFGFALQWYEKNSALSSPSAHRPVHPEADGVSKLFARCSTEFFKD